MNVQCMINADDFGLSNSCTNAICEAFEKNLITDTTMVANGESYEYALQCIGKYHLKNRVGIHFNLTEGEPLTNLIKQCEMFVSDGKFHGKINRLKPLSKKEKAAVFEELDAQVKKMIGDGIHITHADSHHHIHTGLFIAPSVIQVCNKYGIKAIRIHRNIGNITWYKKIIKNLFNRWLKQNGFQTAKYFGSIFDIEVELKDCKKLDDVEIMVHPDYDRDGMLIDRVDECDGIPVGKELHRLEV